MKVENMTSRNGNAIANQFIITNGTKTVFQSYDSMIIEIDSKQNTIIIGQDWDYSTTTGKYRNLFFKDMGFSDLASKKELEKVIKDGYYEKFKIIKMNW